MSSQSCEAECGYQDADGPSETPAQGRLCAFDLDSWRSDLQRLHGTIDQVMQSFISSQTRQLDAVAAELVSQRDEILKKERCFTELSDSIAGFVEVEAQRLQGLGFGFCTAQEDARHEAYDAELPGPPALHRINRLWRKATKAFESAHEAKEREMASALEEQRSRLEAQATEAGNRNQQKLEECEAELQNLKKCIEVLAGEGQQKDGVKAALSEEIQTLKSQMGSSEREASVLTAKIEEEETRHKRLEYDWSVEREELARQRSEVEEQLAELQRNMELANERENALTSKCNERGEKLEEMRRIMDEQELEMTQKIDRVQQYVKERQATALLAEKKQQDAEKMAERWQGEVRKCQAEKDRLAALLLELEGRQTGQAQQIKGASERHIQEVSALQESLRRKEQEMREANLELLSRRDEEYQAKVSIEKQREKERSIAQLKKKEQEVQIKDQQLRAAKQRIQELEMGAAASSASTSIAGSHAASVATSPPSSRSSSSGGKRPGSGGRGGDSGLPPLPLSAR